MKVYLLHVGSESTAKLQGMLKELGHEPEVWENEKSEQSMVISGSPLILQSRHLSAKGLQEVIDLFLGPLLIYFDPDESSEGQVEPLSETERSFYMVNASTPALLQLSLDLALKNHLLNAEEVLPEKKALQQDAIFVRAQGIYHQVIKKNILYLKSDRVYSEIYLQNGSKLVVRESLSGLFQQLGSDFYRVSRSLIVHVPGLNEIGSDYLKVGPDRVLISRKNRALLLEHLNCHFCAS
jgi:hypothetical protein